VPLVKTDVSEEVSASIIRCQEPVNLGLLVTTAWRVLGLRMEGTASSWRLAANILNKQPQTNDKGWSTSLGAGRGANNPSP
jgi:hypothetical protein